MITETIVRDLVVSILNSTDYHLINVKISKDNDILIEIDRLGVVDIDFCAAVNCSLAEKLDNIYPNENYSLEVGSVSLTDPFASKLQYEKHLGHNVVVTDKDGCRHSGQLVSVDEDTFMVDAYTSLTFRFDEVKQTVYNITF